jgi:methyltransferase-like protein/ubiquinone/menaquinone biosynthesis C-methylase UbiE
MTSPVANDYDKVPYESFPYANTDPEQLYTVGKLFSMTPVNPKGCNVLELGCASGGNLIPMAIKYPDSKFVGIDYSKVQIEAGKKQIQELGLKNILLKEMSITDITEKLGQFDYIIAHGILSWVPKDVQDKIFEVSSKNLTKNGIAYISYNTFPGWNLIKSIREMMLYHTSRFESPSEKAVEARRLLNFIKEGNVEKDGAYAKIIQKEIENLQDSGDSYLIHDHLEENNEPFYFHNFMVKADKNNLQYLGDSFIPSMFIGNMPDETVEILKTIGNDIVRTEQYMDFIRNRRFRSTLLCHKDAKINRSLKPKVMEQFYIKTKLIPVESPSSIDLTSNKPVMFKNTKGANITVSSPAAISVLLYLHEKQISVAVKDVVQEVKKRLPKTSDKKLLDEVICNDLLDMLLRNAISINSFPADYTIKVSDKPKASELSKYQARTANWVTSQRLEKINIDVFNRVLIQHLDGQNNIDTIIDKMITHVVNNDITLTKSEQKITDKAIIKEKVTTLTKNSINNLAPNALLVA